jgi:hypothetical protein
MMNYECRIGKKIQSYKGTKAQRFKGTKAQSFESTDLLKY